MKAFEEFMEKNFPKVRTTSTDYEYARQLWRGALDWAQVQKFRSDQRLTLEESIEKELRDE